MVDKLIKKAISFLGQAEPTGDDQFISLYNQITGASFPLNVAWCAIFVSTVARMTNISTEVIPTFANCDTGKQWFEKRGRYELAKAYGGNYIPKKGDIIFYSSKRTQRDSTHVGYCVSADGALKAIEGNKSDKVDYRKIGFENSYIIGYGRVADFLEEKKEPEKVISADKFIWDFLTKRLNKYAAAGIMGNLYAESKLNPKNLQNSCNKKLGLSDEEYTMQVDNGTYKNFIHDSAGYGLAQWTYWSRKEKLLEYCRSRGRSIGDAEVQMEFLWKELQGHKIAMNILERARNVREASDIILVDFEKPADQSERAKSIREKYSLEILGRFDKKQKVAPAQSRNKALAGVYKVKRDLNMRFIPGIIEKSNVVKILKKDSVVRNYGYYTDVRGVRWLYVIQDGLVGYCSSNFLKRN